MLPHKVSADSQIMGHILYNELPKMVEPSLLCLQRCLQVSNSVTIIFGGSGAFSDGALSYFNCTDVIKLKSIEEVSFKILNFSLKGFKFAMLVDKIGGENVEISHDGGVGKVGGGNPVPLESILQDGGAVANPPRWSQELVKLLLLNTLPKFLNLFVGKHHSPIKIQEVVFSFAAPVFDTMHQEVGFLKGNGKGGGGGGGGHLSGVCD